MHRLASLIFQNCISISGGVCVGGGGANPDHFPISSKFYFTRATPLVTDFARMQLRRLKMPPILDNDDTC